MLGQRSITTNEYKIRINSKNSLEKSRSTVGKMNQKSEGKSSDRKNIDSQQKNIVSKKVPYLDVKFLIIILSAFLIIPIINNVSYTDILDKAAAEINPNSDSLEDGVVITEETLEDSKELFAKVEKTSFKALPVQTSIAVPAGSSYLIFGDSMMQYGIGSELENALIAANTSSVRRNAVQSTGLQHPERLNWYDEVDKLIAEQYADVAIISMGLNDDDYMYVDGEAHAFGTDPWKIEYAKKVDEMLYKLLVEHEIKKVVWVGLPIMSEEYWNGVALVVNDIYRNVSDRYINAVYLDSYERFSVDGAYSDIVSDDSGISQVARQPDGRHMNLFGGRIMAELILQGLRENNVIL